MEFHPEMHDSPEWWDLLGKQKGTLLFDVGANIGQAALHMAPHFGRVVSFEPCKESFKELEQRAPANVYPTNRAVSDVDGFIMLDESFNSIRDGSLTTGSGRLTWGPNVGQRGVPAVTLNTAAQEWGTPDVVKIDVEGHEIFVLEGATHLFGYSDFFIEMHASWYETLVRDLLEGYEITRYENDLPGFEDCVDSYYLAAVI